MRSIRVASSTEGGSEGAGPFGQRSGSTRHDPIGVAISHVPEDSALAQWFRGRTESAHGSRADSNEREAALTSCRDALASLATPLRSHRLAKPRRSANRRLTRIKAGAIPVADNVHGRRAGGSEISTAARSGPVADRNNALKYAGSL